MNPKTAWVNPNALQFAKPIVEHDPKRAYFKACEGLEDLVLVRREMLVFGVRPCSRCVGRTS